uniref:Uncharacterized protein n=1 Tax=viral metagenome TaxID=1070528 RepID=A0A6H1ZQ03_9ZZZZ
MSSVLQKSTFLRFLGGGGERSPMKAMQPTRVQTEPAEIARNETLKRLAQLRRATMTSQLTEANVKRKTLGAGGLA